MRIDEFRTHSSGCLHGFATSRRGRLYRWVATPDGKHWSASREIPMPPRPDGRRLWWIVKPPRSLVRAIRKRRRTSGDGARDALSGAGE
jgi:hypothetical protein